MIILYMCEVQSTIILYNNLLPFFLFNVVKLTVVDRCRGEKKVSEAGDGKVNDIIDFHLILRGRVNQS